MVQAGWARKEIEPRGYGEWNHRAYGKRLALFARAIYLEDETSTH
jgi:uncharacterized membrane protein (DUF2068 family)